MMSNPGPSTIRDAIVNYNNFFSPYVCHVCKTSKNLLVCPWCRLISYCCNEHLQLHREQHKEFCLAVVSLSDEIYYSHDITLKKWTELKKTNVRRVKDKLGRNLEAYEEQILLFAKSCLICRRQNNLSIVCESCMSVSMCYMHISEPYEHSCTFLQVCTRLDIDHAIINEPNLPMTIEFLNYENMSNMETYLLHCLGLSSDINTWAYFDFLYSNYFSKPLTLLFYIENMDELTFPAMLTIHVIAGSFTDQNSLSAWEVYVHQMLPHTSLLVIMIDSKLETSVYSLMLCQTCRTQNKEIYFIYFSMTYRSYIRSQEYIPPNLVVGFNIDFENDEMALATALCDQNKPLVLTCKSESKAQETAMEIETTLFKQPVINEINDFASCRPYRDVDSDSVFFLHKYIIIYEEPYINEDNLDIPSNDNQPSSNLFEE